MVDFISEVQEELRKDDYNRWFKKYGPFALTAIVAVVAGTGVMEWNKAQKAKKARITSMAYIAADDAVNESKPEQALTQFLNIADTAPSGYSGLASMRAAELELNEGNSAQAIALLDRAAETFENPRHVQLAQIKAAYILSGQGAYADVTKRATPLAKKDQPYEYLARELLGFAAKESGDVSAARQQFSYLNTIPGVPPSIQQRAKQYLDLISLETANAREKAEASVPSDAETGDVAVPASTASETTETPDENNPALRLMATALAGMVFLSGCSTLSTVGDAVGSINPFDKSAEQKKAEQGDVAGEDKRISLLALDDTLSVAADVVPDSIVIPDAYVNADWPQVGGNTVHVMQHTAASGNLSRLWSKKAGKGSSRKGRVLAPPVIAGNRIFVMDGDNRVTSFDAGNGAKIWDYKVEVTLDGKTREGKTSIIERITNPLNSSDKGGKDKESVGGGVAVTGGTVYVTSGLGVIDALDAQSGQLRWRKRLSTPMHSAPKVAGGRVFAVSDDNELFALNAQTGDVLWTYQGIVESARMLTAPSPAVIDDVVIAPFASGELVALRVQNGGVLWQDALSSSGRLTPLSSLNDIASGPVIADGYVIATAQSGIMSGFDLRTGQRIWTQPAGSIGFPWVAGDFVYSVTTEGQVVCMSKISGAVQWIRQLPAFKNEKKRKKRIAWTGPIMAGERLLTISSRGQAVEVDPFTGNIIREFKIGDPVFIPPVIANETVYILSDDAKLIALK